MRLTFAALAAGFISLSLTAGMAHADAVKVSPHLTVFTKEQTGANDGSPTVLRGSATRRGTGNDSFDRAQIGASSSLWLADPATGELFACEPRSASNFEDRYAHCFDSEAPY